MTSLATNVLAALFLLSLIGIVAFLQFVAWKIMLEWGWEVDSMTGDERVSMGLAHLVSLFIVFAFILGAIST